MAGPALPVRAAEHVGCNAVKEVGAGLVLQAVISVIRQSLPDHGAGGGLAVCSRDDYDLHIPGGNGEDVFRDLHGNDARDRGTAAPRFAQCKACELAGGDG